MKRIGDSIPNGSLAPSYSWPKFTGAAATVSYIFIGELLTVITQSAVPMVRDFVNPS
jgi:hypothetical protein